MTDSASPSQVEPVGLPDWQQRHLDKLVEALTNWRNEDHEDAVTLARSDVIALLEGLKVVNRAAPSPSVRRALEPYFDAALRHADGLSAQLDKPDWKPSRAHIEQVRNTIRNLTEKVRAALAHPAPQDEMREAAETVVKVWKDAPSHVSFGRFMEDALSKLDAALAAQAPAPGSHDFEQWAKVWHQTCETMITLLDLPGSGSPQEMLAQVQAYVGSHSPAGSKQDFDKGTITRNLRGLASRMQYRVEAIETRDGTGAAAITGSGIGIGYLLAKDLADALEEAATYIESLPASPATEKQG